MAKDVELDLQRAALHEMYILLQAFLERHWISELAQVGQDCCLESLRDDKGGSPTESGLVQRLDTASRVHGSWGEHVTT